MTVIEFLTFEVPPTEQAEWLEADERHWSRFLEMQPGFLKKQMWGDVDNSSQIHAVIWWESMEHWKAIPKADLAAVAEAMGRHEVQPTLKTFNVLRDC